MFPDLLKTVVRGFGLRLVQLDAALPEPLETADPISVPVAPDTASLLPRILVPVLAAAILILLLLLLYRRHGKKRAEAKARLEAEAAGGEKKEEE